MYTQRLMTSAAASMVLVGVAVAPGAAAPAMAHSAMWAAFPLTKRSAG